MHSLQDTGERSNSSVGFGLGFSANGISSVSPSFGSGSGSTAWVTEQTGLFSTNDVSVYVGGNTDLLSSVIGSQEGNVTIDTGTLTFADLTDHDNYTDFSINATFNSALWTPPRAPSDQPDPNPVCASIGGCTSPNWTAQGHYAFDDRAQNTITTIGAGSEDGTVTVTIRDTEAQQELEDSGQTAAASEINRDLDTAQVVTRDEHERVDFYLSDSSLQATAQAVGKTVEVVRETLTNVYITLRNSGLFTEEELRNKLSTAKGRRELIEIARLVSSGGSRRTGRYRFSRWPTTQEETTLLFLANNLRGLARRADERGLSLPPSMSSSTPRSPAQEINYLRNIQRAYEELLRGDNGGPALIPSGNQSPNQWLLNYPFYGGQPALPVPTSIGSPRRQEAGVASYGGGLPMLNEGDPWLRGSNSNAGRIPDHIASQLSGRHFNNFDAFRKAFWTAIGNDPITSDGWSDQNISLMQNGLAPFAIESEQVGGRMRYELDHFIELQNNGSVYDMNNLYIRTPLSHIWGK